MAQSSYIEIFTTTGIRNNMWRYSSSKCLNVNEALQFLVDDDLMDIYNILLCHQFLYIYCKHHLSIGIFLSHSYHRTKHTYWYMYFLWQNMISNCSFLLQYLNRFVRTFENKSFIASIACICFWCWNLRQYIPISCDLTFANFFQSFYTTTKVPFCFINKI